MTSMNYQDAYEAWKASLKMLLRKGVAFEDEDGRECYEVQNLLVHVENPTKNITKPIERLADFQHWKYPSPEEIKNVVLSNKLPPEDSYSYGPRIFNFQQSINQINSFIIPLLKETPMSRRTIITLLDPSKDSRPNIHGMPGLIIIHFRLRQNKLSITSILRSNDVFFGWPANIYQSAVLQQYVKDHLGCELGSLSTFSISAHIFSDQFQYIKEVVKQ